MLRSVKNRFQSLHNPGVEEKVTRTQQDNSASLHFLLRFNVDTSVLHNDY